MTVLSPGGNGADKPPPPPCVIGEKPHHIILMSPLDGSPPSHRCSMCRMTAGEIQTMTTHTTIAHITNAVLLLIDSVSGVEISHEVWEGARQELHRAAATSGHVRSKEVDDDGS